MSCIRPESAVINKRWVGCVCTLWPQCLQRDTKCLEQRHFARPHQCLSATADAEFAKDVIEVLLDRANRDNNFFRDLTVGEAVID